MPRLTLAICAVAAALNPLKVCHHKTCSKYGLAKRTLDIAHVLGGPEAAVQTLECQNGCNAGTVSVVGDVPSDGAQPVVTSGGLGGSGGE